MAEIPAEGLMAELVDYKGVSFRILRMPPLSAHQVTEYLRPELMGKDLAGGRAGLSSLLGTPVVLKMIEKQSGDMFPAEFIPTMAGLVDAVLSLSPLIMERLRMDMFNHMTYRTGSMADYEKLLGKEDDCFAGLPSFGIYVLIVRGFLVNFSDSFAELLSLMPGSE